MRRRALRLGVSACLLGEKVRHDGGHKRDAKLLATLGRVAEWVPVCPEMAIGLGAPREPVDLVKTRRGVRMLGVCSGADHTDAMRRWARAHLEKLARLRLHGFVLKSRSPSCGMQRVPVRDARGRSAPAGRGLFAAALLEAFPELPVEEEEALRDPALRASWIERVCDYHRFLVGPARPEPHPLVLLLRERG